jgi:hypothetical protein
MTYQIHVLNGRKEMQAFWNFHDFPRYFPEVANPNISSSLPQVDVQAYHLTQRGKQVQHFRRLPGNPHFCSRFVLHHRPDLTSVHAHSPFERANKLAIFRFQRDLARKSILSLMYGAARSDVAKGSFGEGIEA